jgi:hypothetical protein
VVFRDLRVGAGLHPSVYSTDPAPLPVACDGRKHHRHIPSVSSDAEGFAPSGSSSDLAVVSRESFPWLGWRVRRARHSCYRVRRRGDSVAGPPAPLGWGSPTYRCSGSGAPCRPRLRDSECSILSAARSAVPLDTTCPSLGPGQPTLGACWDTARILTGAPRDWLDWQRRTLHVYDVVRCPSTLSLVPEARLVEGDGPRELATLPLRPHAETRCPRFQEDASRLSCATNVLSRTPANCRSSSEGLASFESPRYSRSSCPVHLAMLETPRTGLPRRCLVAVAGAFDLEWRCGG